MPKRMSVREAKRQIRYSSDPISEFQMLMFLNPHLKGKVHIPQFYERRRTPEFLQRLKRDFKRGFVDSIRRRRSARKYLGERKEREIAEYKQQVKYDFNAIGNFLLWDIPDDIKARLINEALERVNYPDISTYEEGSSYERRVKMKFDGIDEVVDKEIHEINLSLRHRSKISAAHEFMHFFKGFLQERLGKNYFKGVNSHVIASAIGIYFNVLYQSKSRAVETKFMIRPKVFKEISKITEKELGVKLKHIFELNNVPADIKERAFLKVASEELKSPEDEVFHRADKIEHYDEGGEYIGAIAAFIENQERKPWLGLAIIENLMKGKNPEQVFREAEEGKYDRKIKAFLKEFKPPYW